MYTIVLGESEQTKLNTPPPISETEVKSGSTKSETSTGIDQNFTEEEKEMDQNPPLGYV